MSLMALYEVVQGTVKYTGIFMFIVMLASAFAWVLIREQVGARIFTSRLGLDDKRMPALSVALPNWVFG
jgi:TRAP-type C4-dicarboxylate transport system permease large subunit